jgi:hypothetical protein
MVHASLCFPYLRFTNEASAFKTLVPILSYFPYIVREKACVIIMSKYLSGIITYESINIFIRPAMSFCN